MKIVYKKGDLLEATEPYIAHGCNAQGVMGSGVAKLIREKWPNAFDIYHQRYILNGNNLTLGTIIISYEKDVTIYNCITQEFYGKKNKRYCDYDAIRSCMKLINSVGHVLKKDKTVAMPKIGAGLAGGNWDIIEQIIEEELTRVQPVVYLI